MANEGLNRRSFIYSAITALSFVYLPGIGKVRAMPFLPEENNDYSGRLCYNENPIGPSPNALAAMQNATSEANRYPDWYNEELEHQIAQHHGLHQSNICAGNGATEIIRLIANAFLSPGTELITASPTYFQMAAEATTNGASVIHVSVDENSVIDLDAIFDAIDENTKMISLVNPNNPLGTIIHKNKMEDFLRALPSGILVVVDEAYHHYVQSTNYESCVHFVKEGLPIIVIRTFSKIYGLAGARIGYAIAAPGYIDIISSSQLFATVSSIGQAAASAALSDVDHINDTIELNNSAMQYLVTELEKLNVEYIQSETNFIMIDTGRNANTVVSQLEQKGYQVRSGWGMPNHIRVSTGMMDEMHGFVEALIEVLGLDAIPESGAGHSFGLISVSPNPFNQHCNIKFTICNNEKVALAIYDVKGTKITTLINSRLAPGEKSVLWDGTNFNDIRMTSGVYTILLIHGELAAAAKVSIAN